MAMLMHKATQQDYVHFLQNMKVPYKDITSEYILGHALMTGSYAQITTIVDKMEADDFYDLAMRIVYNSVKEDLDEGGSYEGQEHFTHIMTLFIDRFKAENFHFDVSNRTYDSVMQFYWGEPPKDDVILASIAIVKKKRAMRDMIENLYLSLDMCTNEDNGVEKAYSFLGELVFSHETEQAKAENISKLKFAESMTDLLYEYNDASKRNTKTINMPWPKFQRVVGGFGAEELVIVSAKSGQGKSAFSLNIGIEAGVTQKIPTLYINSELSNEQMIERYLSYTCYLDSRRIREGRYYDESAEKKVNEKVYDAVRVAAEKYYTSQLLFKRIPDLQLNNIEKAIRTDCVERHTRLVIVDYLGRMDITKFAGVKDLQEWQIMRLAANRLKTLAQKYHVCIIMVCQLTDEGTLQGSRAIKNEADMWLSINRLKTNDDTYMRKRLIDIAPYNTFINIEKARNINDTSAIKVRYEGAMMRFCDTAQKIKEMVLNNREYGKYANELLSKNDADVLETVINAEKMEGWT